MPTSWKSMSVANLRDIARSYKNLHSLGNISKQPKAILTETLSKVMEWKKEKLYTKKEHGGKEVATYFGYEGEIHNTRDKKPQPKKAEQPKQKKEDDAKKKSVEKAISQAKSASEDAKAIAPPKMKDDNDTLEKLHNKYLKLWKEPYTKKIAKELEEVQDKANKLIRPILKKELEKGFFTSEVGRIDFAPFKYTYHDGEVMTAMDFKPSVRVGILAGRADAYSYLYKALTTKYRWRFFGNVAGIRNIEMLKEFFPDLLKNSVINKGKLQNIKTENNEFV